MSDETPLFDMASEEAAHGRTSYGAEAEDLLVEIALYTVLNLSRDKPGFYVDIGAADPVRVSNTFRLYKSGWRGINVEPNPHAIARFNLIRPRDININAAVGPSGKSGEYIAFDEPLLNGFLEKKFVDFHLSNGRRIWGRHKIPFRAVNDILSEHVPKDVAVDYLNIDVELMEDIILSDWDFTRWTPKVIAAEIHGPGLANVSGIDQHPTSRLLEERGYVLFNRLFHTAIFVRP